EIAPKKRTIKASTATTTTITSVTNAQLKALINKGIADALAAHDVDRSMNSDDSHNSGTGVRRNERLVRETVGHDVAYAMTWTELKKKMTDKYCPRSKRLRSSRMFPEESDKIERYVGGLPDMIYGRQFAIKLGRQKSNADVRRKPLEFQVGNQAMLKVGPTAYKLELPQEPSKVQNTFHVSNLKKCYSDDSLAVPLDGLDIEDKLYFVEEPVKIMDHEVKRLKRSRILIFKVRWNSKRGPEFTWERKDQIRKKYPHLFTKTAPSSSVAS
ncbi:hypothetical protein Tco_1009730, partial [Tanacetum coccineum]